MFTQQKKLLNQLAQNFGGATSNQVTDQPEGSVGEGVAVVEQ